MQFIGWSNDRSAYVPKPSAQSPLSFAKYYGRSKQLTQVAILFPEFNVILHLCQRLGCHWPRILAIMILNDSNKRINFQNMEKILFNTNIANSWMIILWNSFIYCLKKYYKIVITEMWCETSMEFSVKNGKSDGNPFWGGDSAERFFKIMANLIHCPRLLDLNKLSIMHTV